ncbi:site-specific DNA-methyltransferase [Methylomonas sp. OY6]|uniref:site-specific DNA-methyltransferase (adenine-specific) n=1 Tax=Methylomonas defluvii TaxID=3045149 RepID=A0ABU4UKH1_9GAMM|nr:site-specific DNA-methyltransferase [Methylomonas sp. OY6]MDX8129995.1 site-specific DNA-methyltransferase [Methylomonas sp. OY6]
MLEEVPALSYGDPDNRNMLIQGDNLEALKALIPFYAGQVKCIYIDPPYNTRSAFSHYDDNLEHSIWLSMMYPRLELLRELLSEDGSIWVSIDDNEAHYLKVMMDEVFGRGNFVANVLWQKRTSPDARIQLGGAHDHIMVYAKSAEKVVFRKLTISPEQAKNFKNPDDDPRGPWASADFTAQGWRPNQMYKLRSPSGHEFEPPPGRCWGNVESEYKRLLHEGRMWFGKDGTARPRVKNYLSETEGISSWSWWTNSEVGHNQEAKKEINVLFGADDAFDTPKPERLLSRVFEIATDNGDLILDSFLGSGTTAAVAHKMNRRYIGIEMGDHAQTHCQTRLCKVVDGEQGGISKAVDWQGGGGFRFCKLGEPVFDAYGKLNHDIKFAALAAHIWYAETKTPLAKSADSPLLGMYDGTAYYLLYNGILGDRRPQGGNVLTSRVLAELPGLGDHAGPVTIYGESCRLGPSRLAEHNITFKQIPYDVKAL